MTKHTYSLATVIIALIFACLPADALAWRGEKSVGLRGGFTSKNTTATAGLYFSYRFSEHFRFAPKFDYAFQHHGTDAFAFNFDTEYPIALDKGEGKVNFYPIAGLNYSTFTSHTAVEDIETRTDDSDDSSQRTNHFGLNLGAGIEYFATPTLRLSLESKCLLIKQFTGAWLTVGIGYRF